MKKILPSQLSFDLWNTLLSSNKAYKEKQLRLLSAFFEVSNEEIVHSMHAFKAIVDTLVDNHGIGFSTISIYECLSKYFKKTKTRKELEMLSTEVNELFLANPPYILESTVSYIAKLQEKEIVCNAASNTVFTPGFVLERVLRNNGIVFDFSIYSDELEASKPSLLFFEAIKERSVVGPELILHIGDNIKTDGKGAERARMNFKYVANPLETDTFLKELCGEY